MSPHSEPSGLEELGKHAAFERVVVDLQSNASRAFKRSFFAI